MWQPYLAVLCVWQPYLTLAIPYSLWWSNAIGEPACCIAGSLRAACNVGHRSPSNAPPAWACPARPTPRYLVRVSPGARFATEAEMGGSYLLSLDAFRTSDGANTDLYLMQPYAWQYNQLPFQAALARYHVRGKGVVLLGPGIKHLQNDAEKPELPFDGGSAARRRLAQGGQAPTPSPVKAMQPNVRPRQTPVARNVLCYS